MQKYRNLTIQTMIQHSQFLRRKKSRSTKSFLTVALSPKRNLTQRKSSCLVCDKYIVKSEEAQVTTPWLVCCPRCSCYRRGEQISYFSFEKEKLTKRKPHKNKTHHFGEIPSDVSDFFFRISVCL